MGTYYYMCDIIFRLDLLNKVADQASDDIPDLDTRLLHLCNLAVIAVVQSAHHHHASNCVYSNKQVHQISQAFASSEIC